MSNAKQIHEQGADTLNSHLENTKQLASQQGDIMEGLKQSSSLFGVSQAKLQELKQVSQAALNESVTWHQTEERLLTCVSKSRAAELDQEIERLRALRRTAIGAGQTSGKEYKQLGMLIAAAQSERADLDIVAQELEQGALERAIAGQELWRTHLERRRELADYYLQGEISACRMEARVALASALPLLAKLAAKIELRHNILATLVDYTAPRQPDFSLAAPISAATKGEVVGFLAALLPSNTSAVDAAFDQAILAELKQRPPANLIRGDLVNSRAQKLQNLKLQKMQREPKPKPSSAKQRADDLWSFESMQARRKNLG